MFVAAMIIAILGIWISFAFLIVGTIIAFVAYYNIFHEEMIRDETTKILDVIGKNRKNADQVHKTSSAAGWNVGPLHICITTVTADMDK